MATMTSRHVGFVGVFLACVLPLVCAEEEAPTAASVGVSVMLLGSIGFMMSIFYVTNSSDPDFTKSAWCVVSDTISIFSAVLFFQAIHGCIETYMLEGMDPVHQMLVGFAHMGIWFMILQVALAWFSGALNTKAHEQEEEGEVKDLMKEIYMDNLELNLKSWAILLGHVTGFAAINAFGNVQQLVGEYTSSAFFVVLLTFFTLVLLYKMTDCFREHFANRDGDKDEAEELWDEETEETENDVLGLAVSFLAVQCLRKVIRGTLPNVEGELPEEGPMPTNWEGGVLLLCSIIFGALQFGLGDSIGGMRERFVGMARNVISMSFAWSFLFAVQWLLAANAPQVDGMLREVLCAIIVTASTLTLIFFFDKISDNLSAGDKSIKKSLRNLMQAQGILIGFSWERSFDTAVATFIESGATKDLPFSDAVVKLIMACCLCSVVTPAWRWFILPTVMMLEEAAEEKEEEAEREEEEEKKAIEEAGAAELSPHSKGRKKSKKLVAGIQLEKKKVATLKKDLRELLLENRKDWPQKGGDDVKSAYRTMLAKNRALEAAVEKFGHEITDLEKLVETCAKHQGLC